MIGSELKVVHKEVQTGVLRIEGVIKDGAETMGHTLVMELGNVLQDAVGQMSEDVGVKMDKMVVKELGMANSFTREQINDLSKVILNVAITYF